MSAATQNSGIASRPVTTWDSSSPEENYIGQDLPTLGEPNRWEETFEAPSLLWRAARTLRIQPKKFGEGFVFYRGGRLVGSFDRSVTSLTSYQARRACSSRYTLHNYLRASAVPAPQGKTFAPDQAEAAAAYRQALGTPVSVKPVAAQITKGVRSQIRTEQQFATAWEAAADVCASLPSLHRRILVERHQMGIFVRFYVVGEEVVGALARLPFFLVGDGESSLSELHRQLTDSLEKYLYLTPPSAEVCDEYLRFTGRAPEDVPQAGELVVISDVSTARPGEAITVDAAPSVGAELNQLAVDAMWAFPGLSATGVDILTPDLESADGAVVIGVNPAADLSEFRFPTYGQYRRVSVNVIQQMADQID